MMTIDVGEAGFGKGRRPGASWAIVAMPAICAAMLAWANGCASLPGWMGGGPSDPEGNMRASFLFDGAKTRAMNGLSVNASEGWCKSVIARQKANGDNSAWLFLANQRDGSPVPTTMYAGAYGSAVDGAKVKAMRKRLELWRDEGFWIVGWLTADDSPEQAGASQAQHLAHVDAAVDNFDDLVDEWCVGLEMNEDGRARYAAAMIARCKARTKNERVGVHLTAGQWHQAVQWGADTLFYQPGFNKTPATVAAESARVIGQLGGRVRFVCAEYHMSSDSPQAKAIGQAAAAVPGVLGTGNGR